MIKPSRDIDDIEDFFRMAEAAHGTLALTEDAQLVIYGGDVEAMGAHTVATRLNNTPGLPVTVVALADDILGFKS